MVGVLALNAGCVRSAIARKLVEAPNRQKLPAQLQQMDDLFKKLEKDLPGMFDVPTIAQNWRVPREDQAEIAVACIEPADHKADVRLRIARGRTPALSFEFELNMGANVRPAKGTIILLHGVAMRKEAMLPWALHLAAAGYRTVLVDLRGHGHSTGGYITYGAREGDDLTAVLDSLAARNLLAGRVGVLGISYGAAIALQWAAREPRVAAAVAIEPYADAPSAIGGFFREVAGGPVRLLSPASFTAAVDKAAVEAGFSWDDVKVTDAVAKLTFPVLFFHGAHDNLLPVWHSARLRSFAKPGSRLVIRGEDDHFTLSMRLQPIAPQVTEWFDAQLAPGDNAPVAADADN